MHFCASIFPASLIYERPFTRQNLNSLRTYRTELTTNVLAHTCLEVPCVDACIQTRPAPVPQELVPTVKQLVARRKTDKDAARLLETVVTLRRDNLKRLARFSCWNWMLFAWNMEAGRALPSDKFPGLESWVATLVRRQLLSIARLLPKRYAL